jgi:NADH-quinone oxidoreductase subunit M
MIVLLLILIPLIGGFISFVLKADKIAKAWALLISLITLAVSIFGLTTKAPGNLFFSASWMGSLGSNFTIRLDGMSQVLCLLTAIAYPLIFIATWKTNYKSAHKFLALILLTQAG